MLRYAQHDRLSYCEMHPQSRQSPAADACCSAGRGQQAVGKLLNLGAARELFSPTGRDRVRAVERARDLPADRGGGVGVIAQIGGREDGAVAGDLARQMVDQIGRQAINHANRNEVSIQCYRPLRGEPYREIDWEWGGGAGVGLSCSRLLPIGQCLFIHALYGQGGRLGCWQPACLSKERLLPTRGSTRWCCLDCTGRMDHE